MTVSEPRRDGCPAAVVPGVVLEVERGLDQRHVAEGLREVADLPAVARVVLLAEQPDIVAHGQQPLEQPHRVAGPADQAQRVHQPEAAGQEGSLGTGQAVDACLRLRAGGLGVPEHQAAADQLALDGRHRGHDPRVVRRQEADLRDQQHRRVQRGAAVVLGERAAPGVIAFLAHLGVDLVAHRAPPGLSARLAQLGDPDRPVEGDPGHHLGVHEVPPGPPDLPDPLVGLAPVLLQKPEQGPDQAPGVAVEPQPRLAAERDGVDHLAVHVELELADRGVADPHRRRVLVAGQPVRLPFLETALAGHAVHDLHVARVPGDRPPQPLPPRRRLAGVAGAQQRLQGDRGVAQPAVPVVPVPHPADVLGQRGRRGRDDAAGRSVGERLQRDQRPDHGVPVLPLVGALGHPIRPESPGGRQRLARVDLGRRAQVRGRPGEDERDPLAGPDREARLVRQVVADQPDRGAQPDRVGSRDGHDRVADAAHPRQDLAVVEAQPPHALHLDRARRALHDPDQDRGPVGARRHEVDDPHGAARRLPLGLQDQRVVLVAAVDPAASRRRAPGRGRADPPLAVALVAQQRGQAGGRVEPRRAQPVHRAVPADQGRRLHVPDDRVILDERGHDPSRAGH